MSQSLLDFVKEQFATRAITLEAIAKGADVPFSTVQRIASGATPYPRIDTVEKLAQFFREQSAA